MPQASSPCLGKRAGSEGSINTWLAENVYKPFSNSAVLSGKGSGGQASLEKPRMRRLFKWVRRVWRAGYAVLRVTQVCHTFTWLRDRFDDFDHF